MKRVSNGQDPRKANCAKLVQSSTRIRTGAPRKRCRLLVIGDFLLRGPEVPISCPDNVSREVFLLGTHIRVLTEKLLSLVKPADYHLFLLFQVGLNDAAIRRLRNIKRDLMFLGTMFKGSGDQVVFFCLLPVREGV